MKITRITAFAAVLLLTGCGFVKSPDALYRQAKETHGDCTIVSKTKTSDLSEVVLCDTLQNFDYKVTSYMSDISIDGSSFGSLPSVSDEFGLRLREKVIADTEKDIKRICDNYGASYEFCKFEDVMLFLSIYSEDEDKAISAAEECAAVIQNDNKNGRLDGFEISAYRDHYDKYGSITLPASAWKTHGEEKAEYYAERARQITGGPVEFIRKEDGVFSQTGADLNRVVNALGTDYPTQKSSAVEFYYFKDQNGREFYVCNFNYYDKEYRDFSYYTNYKEK